MSYIALIPAAGIGSRFGQKYAKQYHRIHGKTVLTHTIERFSLAESIDLIVLILAKDDDYFNEQMLPENCQWVDSINKISEKTKNNSHKKNVLVIKEGGETRAHSVLNGVEYLLENKIVQSDDWLLVHDAARCCLPLCALNRLIEQGKNSESGAILALPVSDTLKKSQEQFIQCTIDRESLWQAQTPQMFQAAILKYALSQTPLINITDEASALEKLGKRVLLVQGDSRNIKLTYPEDQYQVAHLLEESMNIRIGQGYDVHSLVAQRPLILGGVHIPFHLGLLGHSDADALLHAITDALLGAAGLGDIGTHFPDSADQYKNANSRVLLSHAYQKVQQAGWKIVNIDCTIIAEAPKLQTYIPAMRHHIAHDLNIPESVINIKGKTNEKLGYLGQSEAIETQAIVLLSALI